MSDKTSTRYAILIFILLLSIAAVITFAAFFFPNMMRVSFSSGEAPVNNELLNIPKVESVVYSEDGSEHSVSVDFTLAVNEDVKDDLDTKALQAQMSQTIGKLDYDKINDKGGIDYIKSEVIRDLDGLFNDEDFHGLYIRGFKRSNTRFDYVDMGPVEPVEEVETKPNVADILKAFGKRN